MYVVFECPLGPNFGPKLVHLGPKVKEKSWIKVRINEIVGYFVCETSRQPRAGTLSVDHVTFVEEKKERFLLKKGEFRNEA